MEAISVTNYLNTKLRVYSAQSNVRAIPFIGDGFKEVHRKAIWGIIQRGENREEDTIERIGAFACSATDYHHGAVSMCDTIVKMARKYAGTNLLPLLEDSGQFGNRNSFKPGQPRYLRTKFTKNFRLLFKKIDDLILKQKVSTDMEVEPEFFIPVLPTILINGAEGIGTGHACSILTYNPKDIQKAIIKVLDGVELPENHLTPWFGPDFTGTVTRNVNTGQVEILGKWEITSKRNVKTMRVTELPPSIQGEKYKTKLDKMETDGLILDYQNWSDKNGVDFEIKLSPEIASLPETKFINTFDLIERVTENFTVWDADGKIVRYDSAESLLMDWIVWRLDQYSVRLEKQLVVLSEQLMWALERKQWIELYLEDPIYYTKASDADCKTKMREAGLINIDRLMSIQMRSLTKSKIEELNAEIETLKKQRTEIEETDVVDLMREEVSALKF